MIEDENDPKTWVYCEHGRAAHCDEPKCAGAEAFDRDIADRIRARGTIHHRREAMSGYRFPEAMHKLKARWPKAERIVQLRVFDQGGTVVCIERPCTLDEVRLVTSVVMKPIEERSGQSDGVDR